MTESAHDEFCEADWGPEGQESPCRCALRATHGRTDLIRVIEDARTWKVRLSNGYVATGEASSETIADAVLAWMREKERHNGTT